ncbi:MAG TPA: NAD(P)-dependent oxidoreductase [Terriglobales bacterium]|nr:NAD(P)-dependent oxidoreductase [Terriglobales bacterium]
MLTRRQRYAIEGRKPAKQKPEDRVHNFNEVYQGYTPEEAIEQASRCLYCEHAPCTQGCPLHNDIPAALFLISQGDFVGAAQKFLETSNFPDVCGRICPQEKQCEGNCVLLPRKGAVNVGKLEAFCIDYVRKNYGYPKRERQPATGMTVGVVGAGPAGLAVAEELAARGHEVTVYDAWPYPGGLLLYGIPGFKLNKEIVFDKVKDLEALGIKFVSNYRVGKEHPVEELLRQYDLVFLGYGAIKGGEMKIPGEDQFKNIYQATEYLVRGNLPVELLPEWMLKDGPQRVRPNAGHTTLVIGGGDTAMDCVRVARRLNPSTKVYCVYRRSEVEMPGRMEERIHAREEGVQFEWLTAPVKFLGNEKGEVEGAECIRMKLGEPDAKGRRSPVPIPGSEFVIPCDTVALAIGYSPETDIPETAENLKTTKWGTLLVESEETGVTSREDVYAAGDNVRGADLVVTAVASARKAALHMHDKLMALRARRQERQLQADSEMQPAGE